MTLTENVVAQVDAGWLPLDDLDDAADVPPPLVPHFFEWVRMYAMHREQPEVGFMERYIAGMSFREAKRADSQHTGMIVPRGSRVGDKYRRLKRPATNGRYEAMRHYYERGFHLE